MHHNPKKRVYWNYSRGMGDSNSHTTQKPSLAWSSLQALLAAHLAGVLSPADPAAFLTFGPGLVILGTHMTFFLQGVNWEKMALQPA